MLSELYRQGHNLDISGSASLAETTIEQCIAAFPTSTGCHFSASWFYLSVGLKYVPRAQRSLDTLRVQFAPKAHPEVERGYVFLYMFQREADKASAQIDRFLTEFPNSPHVAAMLKMKEGLKSGIGYRER